MIGDPLAEFRYLKHSKTMVAILELSKIIVAIYRFPKTTIATLRLLKIKEAAKCRRSDIQGSENHNSDF